MLSHFFESRIQKMNKLRSGNKALISKMMQVGIYILAFLVGTHALGINIAALAVLGGTIGIGIGFGLQKITSNFISGVILLFEKSIESGDLIELQGGVLGYVRQTFARYTLIETLDGKEVMVPNENFIINEVVNLSYSDASGRVEVLVGVSYDSDVELAREIMLEAAKEHPRGWVNSATRGREVRVTCRCRGGRGKRIVSDFAYGMATRTDLYDDRVG